MDYIMNYCIEYMSGPYYWMELVLAAMCIIWFMYNTYLVKD